MIAAQRRTHLLEMIRNDGAVSITVAAQRLDISAVTVRRDLDQMAAMGLLARTHGGAVAAGSSRETPYIEKVEQAAIEKEAIGRFAASLVNDGDSLLIGPGTTTEALATHLVGRRGLTIITNSLPVAEAFVSSPENDVVMTGGSLRSSIRALIGETTVGVLRGLHADKTFLSGNGLDATFGLSTPVLAVADTDRAMAKASYQLIALVDHTKVGVRTAAQTVPVEGIARVITDAASPLHEIAALRAAGVEVDIA